MMDRPRPPRLWSYSDMSDSSANRNYLTARRAFIQSDQYVPGYIWD